MKPTDEYKVCSLEEAEEFAKRREMNNEPVVWTACLDCGKRVTGDSIHTCSPQIKELSDEEIYKLAEYHGLNDWLYETSVPDFARAILKKASEK